MAKYFVVDIETVPLDVEEYFRKPSDERDDTFDPFKSRVIAAGIRHDGENQIFLGEDEEELLEEFWLEWRSTRRGDDDFAIVGFNISDFDMPFLTRRSLRHSIAIDSFVLKDLVDLREKLAAYKWRPNGTLEDYARLAGIEPPSDSGERVPEWYRDGDMESIRRHLTEDLVATDKLFQAAGSLNITEIDKW